MPERTPMGHVEGRSRYQRALVAPSLDEQVGAEHPARVVDGFVDALDLAGLGFAKVAAEETGRPAYHPRDLLKLYLYGYANQIRSSRRLEREAQRNIEVRWLTNELTPSFKTIADFRKDHPEAIVGVTRAFVQFCRQWSLYGGELVAIDGTKVEAVASCKKVITPKALERQMAALDRKIAEHLAAMDEADRREADQDPPVDVTAALKALRDKRELVQAQAKALADQGLSQLVLGEREARLMKTARHGPQVAYNAQTAVDAKHGLIAAFDLTNDGNDLRQLLPMAENAQEALQAETLTVVADGGYSNGEQALACQAAGITAAAPRPETVNPKNPGLFTRDAFAYDAQSDSFTCPAGETLARLKISQTEQTTTYAAKACAGCALKPSCTKAARRTIVRSFFEAAKDAMHQRASPALMTRRRCLAEHPFGTIKWRMGYPRFLLRGLKKAKAELAMDVLAFNLQRAITLLGATTLLAKLQAA
jgi:transposase